jgi:nucleolar protein 14
MTVVSQFVPDLRIGDIREDVVRQDHFGGDFEAQETEAGPDCQKTTAEVMSELISKSKMYKHERQQQHDEDLEEIQALDAEMDNLQNVLRSIKSVPIQRPPKTQEMMSYDAALREMVYDKRSKPTERTKTEEEIAQEEMERLQKLEQERLKRMRGEEVDTDEGSQPRGSRREGDDLEDDFVPDEGDEDVYGFGKGATGDDLDNLDNDDAVDEDDEITGEMAKEEDEEEEEEEVSGDDDEFDLAEYFTDEEFDTQQVEQSDQEDEITPATKRLRIAEPSTTTKELAYLHLPLSHDF